MKNDLFDLILDFYPEHHQLLFIASIGNRDVGQLDKLLATMNANICIELPTNNLHNHYNIMRNIYDNLNLEIFKLLAKYGLNMTDELLEIIFVYCNIDLVDYIMSEYHFVPKDSLIKNVFLNFDLEKIELFAKHNIDLSMVKMINNNSELVQSLENCNLDSKILLAYALNCIND